MQTPHLPMSVEDLPQQRLTAVRDLPPRPEGLAWHNEGAPRPRALERASYPIKAHYLFYVEWAWSPMHNAFHAYYLNPRRDHWLLWLRWFDDGDLPWRWRWYLLGWAKRLCDVDDRTAAFHLMIDHWREEAEVNGP